MMSYSGNNSLIKLFGLLVWWRMIGRSRQMSCSQEGEKRVENVTDKLRSVLRQQVRRYTTQYNPVSHEKGRSVRKGRFGLRYGSH